jgi:hypothetical protein
MSDVTTVGIDLPENVFAVHGLDASGAVVLRRTLSRAGLPELVATAVPDRHGGVLRGARVGTVLCGARAYGATDGAEVRSPVQKKRQERW